MLHDCKDHVSTDGRCMQRHRLRDSTIRISEMPVGVLGKPLMESLKDMTSACTQPILLHSDDGLHVVLSDYEYLDHLPPTVMVHCRRLINLMTRCV